MPLDRLLARFYQRTGITFTDKKESTKSKIARFAEREGYADLAVFADAVDTDKALCERLTNYLTISETYFLREFGQVELFVSLMQQRRHTPIKMLCAPCASGEEPYSLLIALKEAGFDLERITVYGIDINSDEIAKAKAARYGRRRLHKLSPLQLETYFFPSGDEYVLKSDLARHAHFVQMNIFEPWPDELNGFDVIFSRNMLIYFDESAKERCEKIFYEKLLPGGMLFLGHADFIKNRVGMEKKIERGIGYYLKGENA